MPNFKPRASKIVKMVYFTNLQGPKFEIWKKLALQSHQRKILLWIEIFYVKSRTFKGCEAHFLFQNSRKFQKNQLIILGEESSLLSRHRIKNREIRLRFGTKNPRNWKFVDEMIWQKFRQNSDNFHILIWSSAIFSGRKLHLWGLKCEKFYKKGISWAKNVQNIEFWCLKIDKIRKMNKYQDLRLHQNLIQSMFHDFSNQNKN